MKSTVDRPIFIVSPHRSGTTLLYGILGKHPSVGYYNRANRRVPAMPLLAHAMTRMGVPDDPMEAQRVWDRFWDESDDVLGAADATGEITDWHRHSVEKVLKLRGADRFLSKYPRLSVRLEWIDAMFPDAIFLHLRRDWRAVVNSTVARILKRNARGGGWFGVRMPGWREMGDLPPELIAGRIFRFVTETIEKDGPTFGDRFFQSSYEELCAAPVDTVRSICERCDLAWTDDFAATVPTELTSANTKWKERLDPEMIETIRAEAPEFFARYETAETGADAAPA